MTAYKKKEAAAKLFKGFRPAVRLNNIRTVYVVIQKILKQQ
jgi:hypothetical protein